MIISVTVNAVSCHRRGVQRECLPIQQFTNKMATQKCTMTSTPSRPMWTMTTVTRRTSTSTTCARSEHACTLLDVLSFITRVSHPHWLKSSLESVIPTSRHAHVRLSLSCSTSPFTSPCTSPSSSRPFCVGCDIVQADHAPEAGVAQGIFHGILVRHQGKHQEEVEERLEEEVERRVKGEHSSNQTQVLMHG